MVSNEAVPLQNIEMALVHQFPVISVIKDVCGNVQITLQYHLMFHDNTLCLLSPPR